MGGLDIHNGAEIVVDIYFSQFTHCLANLGHHQFFAHKNVGAGAKCDYHKMKVLTRVHAN